MEARTAYEACGSCNGIGLQNGVDGPQDCYVCGGDCIVRVRDDRGRFSTIPLTEEPTK